MNATQQHDDLEETRQLRQHIQADSNQPGDLTESGEQRRGAHEQGERKPANTPRKQKPLTINLSEVSKYKKQDYTQNQLRQVYI